MKILVGHKRFAGCNARVWAAAGDPGVVMDRARQSDGPPDPSARGTMHVSTNPEVLLAHPSGPPTNQEWCREPRT